MTAMNLPETTDPELFLWLKMRLDANGLVEWVYKSRLMMILKDYWWDSNSRKQEYLALLRFYTWPFFFNNAYNQTIKQLTRFENVKMDEFPDLYSLLKRGAPTRILFSL